MTYVFKYFFTFLISLSLAVPALAAPDYAKITFVRGKPKITLGKKTIRPRIGRRVPLKASIEIPKKAQLSLLYNGMQLRLRSGKVVLRDVLNQNKANMAQESSFISGMIRPPLSAPAKVMPTKVAGIRGKTSAVPVGKKTVGSQKESSMQAQYNLLARGQFDTVLKNLSKPKNSEEYYIVGLAQHGKSKTAKAKRSLFRAAKHSGKDKKMRVKIETALASMYMQEGRYKKALQRLNFVEKKIEPSYHNAEIYYLLYKNNDLMANETRAALYKKTLTEKYPQHRLTILVNTPKTSN